MIYSLIKQVENELSEGNAKALDRFSVKEGVLVLIKRHRSASLQEELRVLTLFC